MSGYIRKILVSIDQLVNTVLGGECDETISARCYRKSYWRRVALIDWLMREKGHCFNAYFSEKNGTQNAPEYRN